MTNKSTVELKKETFFYGPLMLVIVGFLLKVAISGNLDRDIYGLIYNA